MAGKAKNEVVAMTCTTCKSQNYITTRNKNNLEGKLILKKFCSVCKKITEHKEREKLK